MAKGRLEGYVRTELCNQIALKLISCRENMIEVLATRLAASVSGYRNDVPGRTWATDKGMPD